MNVYDAYKVANIKIARKDKNNKNLEFCGRKHLRKIDNKANKTKANLLWVATKLYHHLSRHILFFEIIFVNNKIQR